jgi:hemerythrin superfamily protein
VAAHLRLPSWNTRVGTAPTADVEVEMDPIEMLIEQHRDAEMMLEQIKRAEGDERQQLFDELEADLALHMELEERAIYPLVEELLDEEDAEEANVEHDLARQALQTAAGLLPDEPGVGDAIDALEASIKHHVEDEEEDVLPRLREKLDGDRLQALEQQMQELMAAGPQGNGGKQARSSSGSGNLEEMTREELYERAKKANVSGRSNMTKDELVAALKKAG